IATIHPDLDLVRLERDVLGDYGKDLLAQNVEQIGLAVRLAFVSEQDLKPLPRYRRRATLFEEAEQVHAALRPKSLSSSPRFWRGTVIDMSSPWSLRAASI